MTLFNTSRPLINSIPSFRSCGRFLKSQQMSKMEGSVVYRSAEAVLSLLRSPEYAGLAHVRQLLCVYRQFKAEERTIPQCGKKKPFIVMEGIDGCGKTTVTGEVAGAVGGVVRSTPPPSLTELRAEFDGSPQELRRAYYALGNYVAASDVSLLTFHTPVVMDRFWHSTAAFALASVEGRELPAEGDGVYEWPEDLLKPDLVLLLDVSEDTRLRRLRTRSRSTPEELRLELHPLFRAKLSAAYRSMRNPSVTLVDGNAQLNQVKESVILLVDQLTDQMETLGL